MNGKNKDHSKLAFAYLILPQWSALFFVIGAIILLLIALPLNFITGLSSSSDAVFAIEALWSCILTDIFFRMRLRKKLVVGPMLKLPVAYCYTAVCIYIFLFQPLHDQLQ
jgi:hypothetical protein